MKEKIKEEDFPVPGTVLRVPLEDGRSGACRIIRTQNAPLGAQAMVAVSPMVCDGTPNLDDPGIKQTLPGNVLWYRMLPPADYEPLGTVELTAEDLDAEAQAFPMSWNLSPIILRAWERLNKQAGAATTPIDQTAPKAQDSGIQPIEDQCSGGEVGVNIQIIEIGDRHALTVECFDMSAIGKFRNLGYEGNGYTWDGIVESIARMISPEDATRLSHSPEADSAMVLHDDRGFLEKVSQQVERAFEDDRFMETVIQTADPEYLE